MGGLSLFGKTVACLLPPLLSELHTQKLRFYIINSVIQKSISLSEFGRATEGGFPGGSPLRGCVVICSRSYVVVVRNRQYVIV